MNREDGDPRRKREREIASLAGLLESRAGANGQANTALDIRYEVGKWIY